MFYEMEIAGLKRNLPLFKVNDELQIAAFVMFGDVEITVASAKALLEKAPEFDILMTAEAKSIPLIHEMSKQAGHNDYVVARKGVKVYMANSIMVEVNSITTQSTQKLYLGEDEVNKIKGKRVVIIDDVISTGDSIKALELLADKAGANIVGKMSVLAEGDAMDRKDIVALHKLPLFDKDGQPK